MLAVLSGCSLARTPSSTNNNSTQETKLKNDLNNEWQAVKSSEKFIKCFQSKNDLDQKLADISPKYENVLAKELNSIKLSTEDEYIKMLYSWLESRSMSYSEFKNMNNLNSIDSEEQIASAKNLLDFIYCPDVNKISINYPLTPDACNEMLLTWSQPFDFPQPGNYKIEAEYNLAVKNFKDSQDNQIESARKCCYEGNKDAGCGKLFFYFDN